MPTPILCAIFHRPAAMDVRLIRHCPTCQQRRRFAGFDQPPWYGLTVTCCTCGDTWSDGERMQRPFARGWRQKSAAKARATWATAARYGSPAHQQFVNEQLQLSGLGRITDKEN